MKERSTQACPRHYFQRKDDFLYEVWLGNDDAGRSLDAFGENAKHDHSGEKNDCEVKFAVRCRSRPSRCKHDRKDKCVDDEHQYRMRKGPYNAKRRSSITAEHIALSHLIEQLALAPAACCKCLQRDRRTSVSALHYAAS